MLATNSSALEAGVTMCVQGNRRCCGHLSLGIVQGGRGEKAFLESAPWKRLLEQIRAETELESKAESGY